MLISYAKTFTKFLNEQARTMFVGHYCFVVTAVENGFRRSLVIDATDRVFDP
jgi:hypothetical protein